MNNPKPALRFRDRYPDLGTDPIPVEVNTSPTYFEREREKIFKHAWWCVGREDEIPKPGDYLVREVEAINASVIVMRGDDGQIRAFHNVCQHRGNKLLTAERGHCRGMVCGFHAWTYNTRGQLNHVPNEDQFECLDHARYALPAVTLDTWNGFVFIHPQAVPDRSLHDSFGELNGLIGDYDHAGIELVAEYSADVKCNWKYFIDAFVEAYHVESVHRRSLKEMNRPEICGGCLV